MKSLIQQRFAINRQRIVAIVMIVLGAFEILFGLSQAFLLTPTRWEWAFFGLIGIGFVFAGVVNAQQSHRNRIAFEAEHGRDAGKQRPS